MRVFFVALVVVVLSGCARVEEYQRFNRAFGDVLDTIVTVIGYSRSPQDFEDVTNELHAELRRLHRLFDAFNTYPDINNIKTINLNAGVAPVEVDPLIIEFMVLAIQAYHDTGGLLDVSIGPVTQIWRNYRMMHMEDEGTAAGVPSIYELNQASLLTGIDDVVIGEGTVFLQRSGMVLDVGSINKAFIMKKAIELVEGLESYVFRAGGDIILGDGPVRGDFWRVGVQNPDGGAPATDKVLEVANTSVFTSGDYQRYFEWEGERFSHLIDPSTLMPATLYRSVTIVHPDPITADILSTVLFIANIEQGMELLQKLGGEAFWILADGTTVSSPGF